MLALVVLANGLAADTLPKPVKGFAVLRLELVLGIEDCFGLVEDANGEEVADPNDENGLTKGLELVVVLAPAGVQGPGEYDEVGRPKLA